VNSEAPGVEGAEPGVDVDPRSLSTAPAALPPPARADMLTEKSLNSFSQKLEVVRGGGAPSSPHCC